MLDHENTHKYNYHKLKDRLEKGIDIVECEISYEKISIERLINGIEMKKEDTHKSNASIINNFFGDQINIDKNVKSPIIKENITYEEPNGIKKKSWFEKHQVITGIIASLIATIIAAIFLPDNIKASIIELVKHILKIE